MIILSENELKRLQGIELEILIEFDRICRKNDIKYSLTGGTLLGAVRHGGFIPWDDDADVSMLRSEYRKFQRACLTDLDHDKFYFQDIENTEGYRWGYGKLRRKDSIFLREHQEDLPYEQGIFIDIFPRDGIPDNFVEKKLHGLSCYVLRKMMWSAVGKKIAPSLLQRLVYKALYFISEGNLTTYYKWLVTRSEKNSRFVRALTYPLPRNIEGYLREWYEGYTDIEFAGRRFMVEKGYLKWLEWEFGDYMKLPPPEKRTIHPVTSIKFPR